MTAAQQASPSPRWWVRRPWLTVLLGTLAVGLPLLVAVARLHSSRWFPVLDLAMTEFRVRDVFTVAHAADRAARAHRRVPRPGQPPGPLSFYLLAPTYRLLGSSSWALEVGTVVVHLAAIATALWIGAAPARLEGRRRRGRTAGTSSSAATASSR